MAALAGWRARARETDSRVLAAALAASVLLHLAFVAGFPQWVAREHMVILPGPLSARLSPAPALPPQAVPQKEDMRPPVSREPRAAATPPKAARAAPEVSPAPPPVRTPPRPAAPEDSPAPPTAPSAAPPAPAAPAAGPQPLAGPAAPQPGMAAAAPPFGSPEVAAAARPAVDEASSVAQYRIALMEAARGFKSYPRLARENNWEGRVAVRVAFAPGGAAASLDVASSSGYPVLDQQALEMIRRAQAKTPVPTALRGREFGFEIPVIFDLRDE